MSVVQGNPENVRTDQIGRFWHETDQRDRLDDVCCSGRTGSSRYRANVSRLTHNGHPEMHRSRSLRMRQGKIEKRTLIGLTDLGKWHAVLVKQKRAVFEQGLRDFQCASLAENDAGFHLPPFR